MPKKASVLKRDRQNKVRRARNRSVKSNMRTLVKRINATIEAGDAEKAREELAVVVPTIDKAASKGVIHKNNASRKIARLSRKVHALTSSASSD
jgi:small subunit ribosomal protein S20